MKTKQTHGDLFDVCHQCESDFFWSPEGLAAAQIPDLAKHFLVEVGLPTFVANFSFELGVYDSDLKEGKRWKRCRALYARTALGQLTPADVCTHDDAHTDPGVPLPVPANFVESIFLPLALDVFFSKPSITNYDIAALRNQDAPNLIHQQAQLALTLLQNMRPQGNKPVRMKPAWSGRSGR